MYEMNDKKRQKNTLKITARECAYLAAFVALVIAAQVVLAAVPGVEIVTVLFLTYAFVFGVKRGLAAATTFSFLRMLVFGFDVKVLVLYLLYFNCFASLFGFLGSIVKKPAYALWWLVIVACVCTVCFTMLDNLLTVIWFSYSARAAKVYFMASLSVMFPQVICTAVSVGALFLPLQKAFFTAKKSLRRDSR